jgi:hypothetical protein
MQGPKKGLEKIKVQFDIKRLQAEVEALASAHKPLPMIPAIDSFPLLTRLNFQGAMYDNRPPLINGPMDQNPSAAGLMRMGLQRCSQDSYLPTSHCKGYLREVILELDRLGYWPRGARINCMKPKSSTTLHKDTVIDQYAISLHIPIITNPDVYCVIAGEKHILEADGSAYFCNINEKHQFFNGGSTTRYHMIMAAWDTQGRTEHFKYQFDYIPNGSSLEWATKTKAS